MSHDALWARPNRRLELEIIHYGVEEFEQDLETLETQPGGAGNPKAETRNPKEIRRPKSENRSPQGG